MLGRVIEHYFQVLVRRSCEVFSKTEALGKFGTDFEIRLGFVLGLDGLLRQYRAADCGIEVGPLVDGRAGQQDVRVLRRPGIDNIHRHDKIELGQDLLDPDHGVG